MAVNAVYEDECEEELSWAVVSIPHSHSQIHINMYDKILKTSGV